MMLTQDLHAFLRDLRALAVKIFYSGLSRYGCRRRISSFGTSLPVILFIVLFPAFSFAAEPVRIGVSSDGELVMIAAARGFFQKAGVDVEIRNYPSGKRSLEGMFSNEVDLSTPAETPLAIQSFERSDFRIIATTGLVDDEFRVLARKDRGIRLYKDLKGRRIAVQKRSALHYFLYLILLKSGLSEKEVTLVDLPIEEQPKALARGSVDAIVTREPYVSEAIGLLGDTLSQFTAPVLYQKQKCLVVPASFLEKNRAAINQILTALSEAEVYAKNNMEQSIEIISREEKVPYRQMLDLWPRISLRLGLDQQLILTLEDEARWAIDSGLTTKKKTPNYLKFINAAPLKSVRPAAVTLRQ